MNYTIIIDLRNYINNNIIDEDIVIKNIDKYLKIYYKINNYIYNNFFDKYYNDILYKYNIDIYNDLIINNRNFHKNEIKKYKKGLFIFNLSFVINKYFFDNIKTIFLNYKTLILNKLFDNYILYFDNIDNIDYTYNKNIILNIIYEDLIYFNIYQKIKNIFKKFYFIKKFKDYLNNIDIVLSNKYNLYYSNINNNLINYEKYIYINNYIYYFNNNINFNIDLYNINTILSKLYYKNLYLNDIIKNNIFKIKNNFELDEYIVKIDIKNIFNYNELKNLYKYKNFYYKMRHIFDDTIYICKTDNFDIEENIFIINNVKFINELIKIKIKNIINIFINFIDNKSNTYNYKI